MGKSNSSRRLVKQRKVDPGTATLKNKFPDWYDLYEIYLKSCEEQVDET